MLSYNQIIKRNRLFQEAHFTLKGFGNGLFSDVILHDQVATFKYPLMYMEDLPSPMAPGVETFVFRVHFMAPVAENAESLDDPKFNFLATNLNEVKSDMRQCAKDFLAFWVKDEDFPELNIEKTTTPTFFEDETEDRLTGCSIDIIFRQPFTYNVCAIPMDGVPSPETSNVELSVNGSPFITIECGNDFDLPVIDQDDNPVGSKVGNNWVVNTSGDPANISLNTISFGTIAAGGSKDIAVHDTADNDVGTKIDNNEIEIADVTQTLNGSAITNNKAETSKAITIRYEDDSPVVVTTITDTETVFIGEVPNPAAVLPFRSYTGQGTSYQDYDDKWYKDAGEYDGGLLQDHYTLYANAIVDGFTPYSHLFRNTGETGGYYNHITATYHSEDGTDVGSHANAFPNGLIRDQLTKYEWYYTGVGDRSWTLAISQVEALDFATHDDWKVPTVKQYEEIRDLGISTPYSNGIFSLGSNNWSSTTNAANTTQAWYVDSQGRSLSTAKTGNRRRVLIRRF